MAIRIRLHSLLLLGTLFAVDAASAMEPALAKREAEVTAKLDAYFEKLWVKANLTPSAPVSEAVFLRRIYLDLVGRIPTAAEARVYLEDNANDRRERLIGSLLSSGGHSRHFATVWRRIWTPQTDTNEYRRLSPGLETWISGRLRENTPYDQLVRDLMLAENTGLASAGESSELKNNNAFAIANDHKPENLAASSTRAFLGLNMDCAQCHDHPFARWKRTQFWEQAAFFQYGADEKDSKSQTIKIQGTDLEVSAKYLDGTVVDAEDALPRQFAKWITSKENKYFARNTVNRIWAQVYGLGLVEPLDDLSDSNASIHEELLSSLADYFVETNFDYKAVLKAMVSSKVYQLSPAAVGESESNAAQYFAARPVRGLSAEQLYDSARTAAGLAMERSDLLSSQDDQVKQQFLIRLYVERPSHAERSITQALALLNGDLISQMTDAQKSPTLIAAAKTPFLKERDRMEILFLATLSRKPTQSEEANVKQILGPATSPQHQEQQLSNLFWALLNSSEFNTNH